MMRLLVRKPGPGFLWFAGSVQTMIVPGAGPLADIGCKARGYGYARVFRPRKNQASGRMTAVWLLLPVPTAMGVPDVPV